RGRFPTGIVAVTLWLAPSITVRSPDFSLVTNTSYSVRERGFAVIGWEPIVARSIAATCVGQNVLFMRYVKQQTHKGKLPLNANTRFIFLVSTLSDCAVLGAKLIEQKH